MRTLVRNSAGMRSLAYRLGRATVIVLLVLTTLLLAAAAVAAAAEQLQRDRFPPPGRLVDIGDGERIHLRTWGARTPGEPAVVLDVSGATPSSAWAWIGQMLGERHFVVAYDRPGMAWSHGPKRQRDAMSAARALSLALEAAEIGPPYVIVGHSYGGLSARAFAGLRRDDVRGLVLLDTTNPDGAGARGFAAFYRARSWLGHAGAYFFFPPRNDFRELPAEEQAGAFAASHWRSHLDTTAEELEAWEVSAAQIRPLGLGDTPLLVVSGYGSQKHVELQRDMLSLSADARFVQLNVDHMGMLVSHDQAQLTAQTVTDFVARL